MFTKAAKKLSCIFGVQIHLFLFFSIGQIINAPTLTEVTTLPGQTRMTPIFGGVTISPAGTYYVAAAATSQNAAMIRSWKNNDSVNWSYSLPVGDDTKVAPVLGLNSTRLFVTTDNGFVYSMDAQTADPVSPASARIAWSYQLTAGVRSQVALSPDNSILYVRTINGLLYALRTSDTLAGGQSRTIWSSPVNLSDGLPPTKGGHTYTQNSPPVVADDGTATGKVFIATANGKVLGYQTSGATAVQILNLNLNTQSGIVSKFQQFGNFGNPAISVEAPIAIGSNGWLYVATRNFGTSGAFQILVAIDPAAGILKWCSTV